MCSKVKLMAFVLYIFFIYLHHARSHHVTADTLVLEDATTNSFCGEYPYFSIKTGGDPTVQYHDITSNNKVTIPYGAPLSLECFGADAEKLVIVKNGVKMETKKRHSVISWATRTADIQNSTFVCADTETGCEQIAIIMVTPAVEVLSPQLKVYYSERIVLYGKSMSVVCSGSAAVRLAMTKDGEKISAKKVNENTIKWTVERATLDASLIECTDVDTGINSSVVIRTRPLLYIQSNETAKAVFNSITFEHYWYSTYGASFEIICTGPKAVKLVNANEDNKELLALNLNDTTVKLLVRHINIGISVFGCVGNDVSDYMSTLHVSISPRIEILSPNGRRVDNLNYVAKYGDPVEIVCSGAHAEQLTTGSIGGETYTINKTTIKSIMKIPENCGCDCNSYSYYGFCTLGSTRTNPGFAITTGKGIMKMPEKCVCGCDYYYYCLSANTRSSAEVVITIETPPKAIDLHCVSHNLQYLNCSWTASSCKTNYTLFAENGVICAKEQSSEESRFCVWYRTNNPSYTNEEKVLSLLMQSCNGLDCYNQSFLIDHLSIVRLAPPQNIITVFIGSRGAQLGWGLNHIDIEGNRFWSDTDYEHKVQYLYSGAQPSEVNSTLVFCAVFEQCNVKLDLPCPGIFYQVSVYQKLKRAIGDEFWSEPSFVTFNTLEERGNASVDATCDLKPEETAAVVKYFVQQLQHKVHLEMPQIKKKVESLLKKRWRIYRLKP